MATDALFSELHARVKHAEKVKGVFPFFILNLGTQGAGKSSSVTRILDSYDTLGGAIPSYVNSANTVELNVDDYVKHYLHATASDEATQRRLAWEAAAEAVLSAGGNASGLGTPDTASADEYYAARAAYADPTRKILTTTAFARRANILREATGSGAGELINEMRVAAAHGYKVAIVLTMGGLPNDVNGRLEERKRRTGQTYSRITMGMLEALGNNFVRFAQFADSIAILDNSGAEGEPAPLVAVLRQVYRDPYNVDNLRVLEKDGIVFHLLGGMPEQYTRKPTGPKWANSLTHARFDLLNAYGIAMYALLLRAYTAHDERPVAAAAGATERMVPQIKN
jgi:hypothetical protein